MATEGVSQLQAMQNVLRANRGLATGEDAPGQDTPVDDDIPDLAVGLEEEGVAVKTGKPRKRKEKLTEFAFLSSKGIPMLYEEFPRLSFSQERGHEAANLKKLIRQYRLWARGVFPHAALEDFHAQSRGWGSRPVLSNHLRVMRGMEASRKLGDPVDEGALYEDAADRLMAMQPAEPSPEDDAMGVSSSVAGSMPQPNANAVFGAASTQQEPSRPAAPPAEPKFDDGDIEMNDELDAILASIEAKTATQP